MIDALLKRGPNRLMPQTLRRRHPGVKVARLRVPGFRRQLLALAQLELLRRVDDGRSTRYVLA
jgi:hypothetical protein